MSDGWTGKRDGPFRGSHLVQCPKHPGIWRPQEEPCLVCQLTKQLEELRQRMDKRCAECKKGHHETVTLEQPNR